MRSTTNRLNLQNALELAAEYIAKNFNPEDIFTREQLVEWALDNGFTETEEEA